MSRAGVIALLTSVATIVVVLALLEILRRRGMDPVARLADAVAPPTMSPVAPAASLTSAARDAAVSTSPSA
jgi:hypothetical protein